MFYITLTFSDISEFQIMSLIVWQNILSLWIISVMLKVVIITHIRSLAI